jgi:soluble cytochrome b562
MHANRACVCSCTRTGAHAQHMHTGKRARARMHMQDADKDKQKKTLLPDEGLPMVKPEIVKHLEKDVHDPDSQKLLGTIRDYCSQKDKLHDQVKFIFARARNNNAQTVHKAQEMREAALTTWAQIQTEMSQKIKDDERITEFDDGQRFFITLIGAENLPMQDQVTQTCGCAVCWRGPPDCNPHIAQPAA